MFREFDIRSKHFLLSDQFINSHNIISSQSLDMLGENWCLSPLALKGLKQKLIIVNMRGLSKIGSGGILITVSYFQECAMFVCIVMDYYKLGE